MPTLADWFFSITAPYSISTPQRVRLNMRVVVGITMTAMMMMMMMMITTRIMIIIIAT